MPLTAHPTGDYRFLPGIAPYSCGVVSSPGFEIVHATFHRPPPYRKGFEAISARLHKEDRPKAALCAIELRSPKPFTFDGFAAFNAEYARILKDWGVFVDGVNPVARTNVAPEVAPPAEPSMYGFSYTRPISIEASPTFVVAGAGELPEGVLEAGSIVRGGETSPEAIAEKTRFVMDLMESRLLGLGGRREDVTAIDVYTIHPYHHVIAHDILERLRAASEHGLRWFYTRPPIIDIEFEMDLRGVRSEIRID